MARGWESKSVEAQQAEAEGNRAKPHIKLSPEQAARFRERENLRLARHRILEQIANGNNPRHIKLLEMSLADVDERLRKLE